MFVFPAAPHSCVSARPKEGICEDRGISERRGIVSTARRVVQCLVRLVSAIRWLIHRFVITVAEVQRLQDVEIIMKVGPTFITGRRTMTPTDALMTITSPPIVPVDRGQIANSACSLAPDAGVCR
jgi:hypothetical protein